MSTQYSTVAQLMGVKPSWIPPADLERISSYAIYEDMYWNVDDTFKLFMRGTNANPVYVPSAKIIIEATNRFLAKNFRYVVDPAFGSDAERKTVAAQLDRLFKRENFYTKFQTQRRYGLIRGDALWHVVADPSKLPGKRISLYELDPATYFPIYLDDDLDKLVGCHIVDQIEYKDNIVIRRQTYRKTPEGITTELALFELAKWDDRPDAGELKKVAQLVPVTLLPPAITQLPVYHVKNTRTPGDPFGSSELRGMERILASINQAMSDEDLALALDGIGMYVTTSGPPVDDDGEETAWNLGPGKVVEIDSESTWTRVNGISSTAPFIDHVKFLMGTAQQASGIPDIAAGNVEVSVAESGVALALHLQPILAKNAEKETEMLGIYDHFLYDLVHMWLPAYEGIPVMDVEVTAVVDDPMPRNKKAEVQEILTMVAGKVLSVRTAHAMLIDMGYDIPDDEFNSLMEEAVMTAAADPFTQRVNAELDGENSGDDKVGLESGDDQG